MTRLIHAIKAFWLVLTGTDLAPVEAVDDKPVEPEPPAAPEPEPGPDPFAQGAVYALILLQREGRLVDFLQEDMSAFADEQIGAAARRIHTDCAKVLEEHFHLAQVRSEEEGARLALESGFDPSAVKLTGNVPDGPPYEGVLQHQGWRAEQVDLPQRSGEIDPLVVQPAVLEI